MERSDFLLFLKIHQQDVYFIDVRPHNEQYVFAQKELLRITHDEWPYILEQYKLKGVLGISNEIDDPDKIIKMRKAGVNVIHRVGKDYYVPMGGGITHAGTSTEVTIEVNNLYRMARNAAEYIQKNKQSIAAFITDSVGAVLPNLDFHLILSERGFFVFEKNSNCIIPIN